VRCELVSIIYTFPLSLIFKPTRQVISFHAQQDTIIEIDLGASSEHRKFIVELRRGRSETLVHASWRENRRGPIEVRRYRTHAPSTLRHAVRLPRKGSGGGGRGGGWRRRRTGEVTSEVLQNERTPASQVVLCAVGFAQGE